MPEDAAGVLDDYEIAIRSGRCARDDFLRQNTGPICAALVSAAEAVKGRGDMLRVVLTLRAILWNATRDVVREAIKGIAERESNPKSVCFVEPVVKIAVERVSDMELAAAAADSAATILGCCALDTDDSTIARILHAANEQTRTLVDSLITEVALTSSPRALAAVGALLRRDYARQAFCGRDGVSTLAATLATDANYARFRFQPHSAPGSKCAKTNEDAAAGVVNVTYNACLAVWMLSFSTSPACVEVVLSCAISAGLTLVLTKLLDHATGRQLKIVRVILATLKNLASGDTNLHGRVRQQMIGADLLTILRRIRNLATILAEDDDAADDAAFVEENLANFQKEMSTLDIYLGELRARALRWSPVHSDETFWAANAERLVTETRDALRIITDILGEKSPASAEAQIVACSDLAHIVRYSVNGRAAAMATPNLKARLMNLMAGSEDPDLRRMALACVSLLLVTSRGKR